jgi:hypothetical protein
MPSVRFVQGTVDNYSAIYDIDWPIVPRVGEYLSMTSGRGFVSEWKVTRICHVGSDDKGLIGTLAWIEHANAHGGAQYPIEPGTF